MSYVDLALVLAFAVAWPAYGARVGRTALQNAVAAGATGARRAQYHDTMFMLWLFAGLAAAAALEGGRTTAALRIGAPAGVAGVLIGVIAAVLILGFLVVQGRAMVSPAGQAAVREQLRSLAWFLPHDAADRAVFRRVSVTAGICEEWLFRGYLLALLEPTTGTAAAVGISAALFGLAHAYQGVGGILKTGLVGLAMGGLAWATGSIWAPILIHAAADWIQGDQISRILGEEPVASAA